MLSSLLDSIKQQFTSKSYWLGSMMPLLLFLFVNGWLFELHSPGIAKWLTAAQTLQNAAFQYSAIVAVLLAAALVLSIMSTAMLGVLEGRFLGIFAALFFRGQWRAHRRLEEKSFDALEDLERFAQIRDTWLPRLRNARVAGNGRPVPTKGYWYGRIWFEPEWHTRVAIGRVRWLMRHGVDIPARWIEEAAGSLAQLLPRYDASLNLGKSLDSAHQDLLDAMEYALDRAEYKRIHLLDQLQFHFPGDRKSAPNQEQGVSPNRILAPTRMGNIGRTMQTYAKSRYNLNLDIFWTRLQSALQKDGTAYFGSLQDAKAQLDCTVTLTCLGALFTILWAYLLLRVYGDSTRTEFRWVMVAGSLATYISYRLACQSYRTFADVVRSCVDLFRLKILDNFSLPQPYGTDEERCLWERLGETVGYGERDEFRYKTS